jgi:hypothetical protein
MEENGWKYQLSLKFGGSLLNVRADSAEEFAADMDEVVKLSEAIKRTAGAYEPITPAASFPVSAPQYPIADVRAAPPPAPASAPAPAQGQEVGPVTVEKIDQTSGVGQSGKPYTRFMVQFSGNVKASTFDSLTAGAAKSLLGKLAYATLTKWEKGYNLESVRAA